MWQCVKCPILITVLSYAPGPQQHVLNMAASNEGIAGALSIIEDMIARLDSLNDPDCIEGFAIRLEVLEAPDKYRNQCYHIGIGRKRLQKVGHSLIKRQLLNLFLL